MKKKIKSIKPFYTKKDWYYERIKSLIATGEIKSKKDLRPNDSRVSYKQYKIDKKGYYKKHLSNKVFKKYEEFSKKSKIIQKELIKTTKDKLTSIRDSKNRPVFTEHLIKEVLSQPDIVKIMDEASKSIESAKIHYKKIKHTKGQIYEYATKKWYSDEQYFKKIEREKYWDKIRGLSKSLNISIKDVRELYALGGDDFFEGLTEAYDIYQSIQSGFATPKELKKYWEQVRAYSKRNNVSIRKTRNLWKHLGKEALIKRGK